MAVQKVEPTDLPYFTIIVIPLDGGETAYEQGQRINKLYAEGFRVIDEQIIAIPNPRGHLNELYMIISLERLDGGSKDGDLS